MTRGLTVCPDCNVAYDTIDRAESEKRSIQALKQECPECGNEETVGIVNYPHTYEVIGPAVEGDECDHMMESDRAFSLERHGGEADYRVQRVGGVVKGYCDEHLRPHQRASLRLFD